MTYACHVIQPLVTSAYGAEISDDVTRNLLPHLLQVPHPHTVVCKSRSLPPTFDVSSLPPDAFTYDDGTHCLLTTPCFNPHISHLIDTSFFTYFFPFSIRRYTRCGTGLIVFFAERSSHNVGDIYAIVKSRQSQTVF